MTGRRTANDWEKIVRRYCANQQAYASRLEFCEEENIYAESFRRWLRRFSVAQGSKRVMLKAASEPASRREEARLPAVAASKPLVTTPAPQKARVALTERDLIILRELAHDRVCGLDVIALRHFPNEEAARKGLARLRRGAYVSVLQREAGAAMLTQKGARIIGARRPRRMHPRHLDHHLKTLRAVEELKQSLKASGSEVLPFYDRNGNEQPYRLEIHVQAAERGDKSSRGTTRGTKYDAAPDAVVQIRTSSGEVQQVAVEYFTASYSKDQILAKNDLHRLYDKVLQVADKPSTAARVEELTGRSCSVTN